MTKPKKNNKPATNPKSSTSKSLGYAKNTKTDTSQNWRSTVDSSPNERSSRSSLQHLSAEEKKILLNSNKNLPKKQKTPTSVNSSTPKLKNKNDTTPEVNVGLIELKQRGIASKTKKNIKFEDSGLSPKSKRNVLNTISETVSDSPTKKPKLESPKTPKSQKSEKSLSLESSPKLPKLTNIVVPNTSSRILSNEDDVSSVGDESNSFKTKSSGKSSKYSIVSQKSGVRDKVYKEILKQKKKKNSSFELLSAAEIYKGGSFCRNNLFRRAKFATETLLPRMATELFDLLEIKQEEDKNNKLLGVCDLIKANVNSRRSYCIKNIKDLMRKKYLDDTMFPIDVFDKFYQTDDEGNIIEPDDEVANAYFDFIHDFCKCTSYFWADILKNLENETNATFQNNLTGSDEAFAMWCIIVYAETSKQEAEDIKEMGKQAWNEKRVKTKKGAHRSLEHHHLYLQKYKFIREVREKKALYEFWQRTFFNKFFGKAKAESRVRASPLQSKSKKIHLEEVLPETYD